MYTFEVLTIQRKSSLVGTMSTVTIRLQRDTVQVRSPGLEDLSWPLLPAPLWSLPRARPCDSSPGPVTAVLTSVHLALFGFWSSPMLVPLPSWSYLPLNCHLFTEPNPNYLSGTNINVTWLIWCCPTSTYQIHYPVPLGEVRLSCYTFLQPLQIRSQYWSAITVTYLM